MSSYADVDDVKNSLTIQTTDTFADTDLERCIAAASDIIDRATGNRSFVPGDEEERLFSPDGAHRTGVLPIDDLIEITTLRVDPSGLGDWETWTEGVDFRLEPHNAATRNEPYTIVRSLGKRFPSGPLSLVEVTGTFGWSQTPQAIVEATGLIAKQLFIRDRQNPWGFVTAAEGAVAYISRTDPHVASLIQPFTRRPGVASFALS